MGDKSYGGSVAEKPARLARYTKADRDTILRKYRKLQAIHATEHARVKVLLGLLSEAQPNLAEYVIMVADQPGSLWSRIHAELAPMTTRHPDLDLDALEWLGENAFDWLAGLASIGAWQIGADDKEVEKVIDALIQRLREAEAGWKRASNEAYETEELLHNAERRNAALERVREAAEYARDQLTELADTDHYGNEVARAYAELNETLKDFAAAVPK